MAVADAAVGENGADNRAEFEAMIRGGVNVAIRNYPDPDCDYYIAQLDANPWYVVPPGPNLVWVCGTPTRSWSSHLTRVFVEQA